jgi:hypothetical protein
MKNNTKVRLHLSKKLFESLTREIIKEAKVNDGYTEAVKQPKQPKQSKSQATSPEVQKTDAEAKMEAAPVAGKTGGTATTGTLRKDLLQKAQEVPKLSGISHKEVAGLQKLLNTILAKAPGGELAMAIDKAQRALDISTQNIKAGEKSIPNSTTPTSIQTMNAAGFKDKPAIPGLKEKMSSKEKMAKGLYNEMEFNVAEEGQAMDKGTDTLKEYENDDYRVVNGECRRYNDEHEYVVVSMSNCR